MHMPTVARRNVAGTVRAILTIATKPEFPPSAVMWILRRRRRSYVRYRVKVQVIRRRYLAMPVIFIVIGASVIGWLRCQGLSGDIDRWQFAGTRCQTILDSMAVTAVCIVNAIAIVAVTTIPKRHFDSFRVGGDLTFLEQYLL
jgi:hypothetical protein